MALRYPARRVGGQRLARSPCKSRCTAPVRGNTQSVEVLAVLLLVLSGAALATALRRRLCGAPLLTAILAAPAQVVVIVEAVTSGALWRLGLAAPGHVLLTVAVAYAVATRATQLPFGWWRPFEDELRQAAGRVAGPAA
jgi:hypothetical protein